MVLRYGADAPEAVICAACGPDTDWVRNLRAGPAAKVRLGRESFTPQHRFLSEDEAFDVAVQFRHGHPRRQRPASALEARPARVGPLGPAQISQAFYPAARRWLGRP